jgi:hypothetical protein
MPSARPQAALVASDPGELCASRQLAAAGPGHHIARSATKGWSSTDSSTTETPVFSSSGAAWSTQMLKRLLAATSYVRSTVAPDGSRNVARIVVAYS